MGKLKNKKQKIKSVKKGKAKFSRAYNKRKPSKKSQTGKQKLHTPTVAEAVVLVSKSGKRIAIVESNEEEFACDISSSDIFVLHKDRVLVKQITKQPPLCTIIKVLKRAHSKLAGCIVEQEGGIFFKSYNPNIQELFPIQSKLTGSLKQDTLYEAKIKYESDTSVAQVIITKELGPKHSHEARMQAILINHGFEQDFPTNVKKEALDIWKNWYNNVYDSEFNKREDFTQKLTFTIDPETAKDHDDAISFQQISKDLFEVGIHIADVGFFVRPGSAIDKEAQKRATSVYLVDRTIHMLPPELSSDVCSLVPNQKRFAFSIIFQINKKAEVQNYHIAPTVIESDYKLSYQQAQQIIDTQQHEDQNLIKALTTLNTISQTLKSQRKQNFALDFYTPELEFELDEFGRPISIKIKPHLQTMSLIEELMLLANKTVAKWFSKHAKDKFFVFRVHDEPDHEKMHNINLLLNAYGYGVDKNTTVFTRKHVSQLIEQTKDTHIQDLAHTHIIKSLAKAQYDYKNIGHFSLGFQYYTHFTSPIRRYPDIMVHRLVKAHLDDTKLSKEEIDLYKRLVKHSTEKEIEAMRAERDSIKEKQIEYMMDKVGQIFEGRVSGVLKNGFFVTEVNTLTEGFIPVHTVKKWLVFDEKRFALVSKDGTSFAIGDKVKVRLTEINPELKSIRWELVES